MINYVPNKAYIDPKCLKLERSKQIVEKLEKLNVPLEYTKKVEIKGDSPAEIYMNAKNTVLVTVNSQKKLAPCRPSADYQFSLTSSCPGNCEYCYLQTTQGEKPYIKIFANVEEILQVIDSYIEENKPNITTFECASITDPIGLEHLTGSLGECIEYFGGSDYGRLRLVTKFADVDSLLNLNHNKHTRFRFSINAKYVIQNFEHKTASFEERMEAVRKIAEAGYPIGFIVAPIMIFDNWQQQYNELFERLKGAIGNYQEQISFELIQHRFTATAKELIQSRFKNTKLDMEEQNRQLKWGPYGKFKYVYKKEQSIDIKNYITKLINTNFNNSNIEYFT